MATRSGSKAKTKSKPKKRKTQSNGPRRVYIILLILFIGGFFTIQLVRLYQKNQAYVERQAALTQELEELQEEQAYLEEQEEYVSTWEYIEQIAKQKLGLFFENEIIFREE